jgi:hypothetical protein
MSIFLNQGYQVVHTAISKDAAGLAAINYRMLRDTAYYANKIPPEQLYVANDSQVEKSFAWYGSFISESLLIHLLPVVENVTGKKLYPTYSYGRIYYTGAVMAVHTDRPSCQYSATITIEKNTPWPIWMENFQGMAAPLDLEVGDMCVYRGDKLPHWREEYTGTEHIQFFLHYVDVDGEYADYKFDKRAMIGLGRT